MPKNTLIPITSKPLEVSRKKHYVRSARDGFYVVDGVMRLGLPFDDMVAWGRMNALIMDTETQRAFSREVYRRYFNKNKGMLKWQDQN